MGGDLTEESLVRRRRNIAQKEEEEEEVATTIWGMVIGERRRAPFTEKGRRK